MPVCIVVEDHLDTRDGYVELLAIEGITAHVAQCADDIDQLLQHDGADAIVMDLQLPREDGWSLIRDLKARAATKDIPVVVVSACVREVDREQALEAGAEVFLTKPCDPADLLNELRRLMDREAAPQNV